MDDNKKLEDMAKELFMEKVKKIKGLALTAGAFIGAIVVVLLLMVFFKIKLHTISGIIVALVVAAICTTISKFFEENFVKMVVRAAVFGILYAVIYITVPKTPVWLAMIMLAVTLAMMGYLVHWWRQEGSAIKELVAFIALDLLITWGLGMPSAAAILDVSQGVLAMMLIAVPRMVCLLSIGYFVANLIWFRKDVLPEGGDIA